MSANGESGAFLEKCGSAITKECEGKTVPMTEAGWQKFTGEIVGAITFLLQATAMGGASEFSFTMMRAVNALKCMVQNLGNNFWNIFGFVWYFALEFKFEAEIVKYTAEYYPYVCTCRVETDLFAELMKATANAMVTMGGCSEKVQKADAENAAKNGSK